MLENLEKYKIILASNSPRRKELLSGLGIKYEVKTLPGIEETYPDTLKAEEIPLYIACEKAAAYRNTMHPDELIITADTIVWLDGVVMRGALGGLTGSWSTAGADEFSGGGETGGEWAGRGINILSGGKNAGERGGFWGKKGGKGLWGPGGIRGILPKGGGSLYSACTRN